MSERNRERDGESVSERKRERGRSAENPKGKSLNCASERVRESNDNSA